MTTQIELSQEQLKSILMVANQSCAYWASTNKSLTCALFETVFVYLNLEEDNQKMHCLLPVMLESAATEMLKLWRAYRVSNTVMCQIMRNNGVIDGVSADKFVQIALFGEVRYSNV
jgi:hypothetical protein